MIQWRPIAEMPEAFKDGRDVLVGWWDRNVGGWSNPRPDEWSAVVCRWRTRGSGTYADWELAWTGSHAEDADIYGDPTHFAEITPPL